MSRGVDVSKLTSNPDFAFGIGSATSEAAKNLLFPEDVPVDAAKQELYKKSHAGEAETSACGFVDCCAPLEGMIHPTFVMGVSVRTWRATQQRVSVGRHWC
jgi:hypothetical protein